jgi:uncharacterized protein (DUF885 family)
VPLEVSGLTLLQEASVNRRTFLGSSAAFAASSMVSPSSASEIADRRFDSLVSALLEEELAGQPELAGHFGLDQGTRQHLKHRLNDYSITGKSRWLTRRRSQLARLRAIDPTQLTSARSLDHAVLLELFEAEARGRSRFPFGEVATPFGYAPFSPYAASQLSGPHRNIPDFLASTHVLESGTSANAYLDRLVSFVRAIADTTEVLENDFKMGIVPPHFAKRATVAQLDRLIEAGVSGSTVIAPLATATGARRIPPHLAERAAMIVEQGLLPALERQRQLISGVSARADEVVGIWALPDGDAYYGAALAYHTSPSYSPEQVHAQGTQWVSELSEELDGLLQHHGVTAGTIGQRLAALRRRPDQLFANTTQGRRELIDYLHASIGRLADRLPVAFHDSRASPVEILPVPADLEDGAPAGYALPPAIDGSRPGRFYINLRDTAEWPKFMLPTLAFHEASPGHQWHGAMVLKSEIPLLRRLIGRFAAYDEGWAVYAEALADELGAYEHDPLGRIGYLQSLLMRAARLVVDTGIHAKRWSREHATTYLATVTGITRSRAQSEVDRYCVWPAQACSYGIGYLEWRRVRRLAAARSKTSISLARFHSVLARGPVPLRLLEPLIADAFDLS